MHENEPVIDDIPDDLAVVGSTKRMVARECPMCQSTDVFIHESLAHVTDDVEHNVVLAEVCDVFPGRVATHQALDIPWV